MCPDIDDPRAHMAALPSRFVGYPKALLPSRAKRGLRDWATGPGEYGVSAPTAGALRSGRSERRCAETSMPRKPVQRRARGRPWALSDSFSAYAQERSVRRARLIAVWPLSAHA